MGYANRVALYVQTNSVFRMSYRTPPLTASEREAWCNSIIACALSSVAVCSAQYEV